MVTPQEQRLYRGIGGRLAVVLRQRQGQQMTPSALNAIAADLVGEHTELLPPLKELLNRPGFQLLITKAGSGSGVVERRALLADLEWTFTPAVVGALEEMLAGFLDLPTTSGSARSEGRATPRSASTGIERAHQRQQEQTAPPPATQPVITPRLPTRSGNSVALALGVCIATATLAVGGEAVIRSPLVCPVLGLCSSSGPSADVQQALDAARRTVTELENATSLASYRSAAEKLELELQRLRSENLTPEQRQQEQELLAISRKAQAAVLQDETDLEQLEEARMALDAARYVQGNQQQIQLAAAEQALHSIDTGGFAASEATRLRVEIGTLKREQPVGTEAPSRKSQPQARSLPGAPSHPRPTVPTAPAASKPVTPAPEVSPGGQWREEPLF